MMRSLIVEDDVTNRTLLQAFLAEYGDVDAVENGRDAIDAFAAAVTAARPYDVICLDIMMPNMNGHVVLQKIREIEQKNNVQCLDGVKVIMVTALHDSRNVLLAFREQCEAYLVKPVDRSKLVDTLRELTVID